MTGQSVSVREADDVVLPTTMPAILRLGGSGTYTGTPPSAATHGPS